LNTVPERYRQTDRRTDGQLTVASPRSALASRGKNYKQVVRMYCRPMCQRAAGGRCGVCSG